MSDQLFGKFHKGFGSGMGHHHGHVQANGSVSLRNRETHQAATDVEYCETIRYPGMVLTGHHHSQGSSATLVGRTHWLG